MYRASPFFKKGLACLRSLLYLLIISCLSIASSVAIIRDYRFIRLKFKKLYEFVKINFITFAFHFWNRGCDGIGRRTRLRI